MIRIYRAAISPALTVVFTPLGFGCRFRPTCSQYASEAIRAHGAWRGALLALRRVGRCHPWGGSGYDPVPVTKPQIPNPKSQRSTKSQQRLAALKRGLGFSLGFGFWALGFLH